MSTHTIDTILCDEAILRVYTTYILMSGGYFNIDSKHKVLSGLGKSLKNTIKIIAQMRNHASQWHVLHTLEYPVGYPLTVLPFCAIEISFLVNQLASFSLILLIFFWMHSNHVARIYSTKQMKISEKNQQIQPSPDRIVEFFFQMILTSF